MIYLILLVGFLLRLVNLNQSFWLDEAAQVIESHRPLSQQLDIASDFHPPLYHLLLHFWMYLGQSEVIVRSFSVILSLATILILYKLVVKSLSEKMALIIAFFLAINPYHIWYSQEARPYMLFVFTSLVATYFLVKSRNWAFYTLSLTAALYSGYTSFLVIPTHLQYVYWCEKKLWRDWWKSVALSLLLFLPWMPYLQSSWQIGFSGALSGWTKVVSVSAMKLVPLTLAKFIFGRGSIDNNLVYATVIMPLIVLFLIGSIKALRHENLRSWWILFWVPLVLAQLISLFLPVMAPQRLIFLLPFFTVLMVLGLTKLKGKLFNLLLGITVVVNLVGMIQYYTNPHVQREQWRQAVQFVENTNRGNSLVIFVFADAFAPWLWYSQGRVDYLSVAPTFSVNESELLRYKQRLINTDQIFYFYYLTDLTDPDGKTIKFIQSLGFTETSKHDFPGVGFISIYEKVLASF